MSQWLALALFYQIPEGILMMYVGVSLVSRSVGTRPKVLAGAAFGLLIPVVRELIGLPYHTIVLLLIFFGICYAAFRLRFHVALLATAFAFTLLILGEIGVMLPVVTILMGDPEKIMETFHLSLFAAWIGALPLLVVAILLWRGKISSLFSG